MHSQESGPTSQGGQNPTPLAFSLAFAVGVICFPVGVQPPTNFYPGLASHWPCVTNNSGLSTYGLITQPAHKGMARLSWPVWLVTHRDERTWGAHLPFI